MFIGKREMKRGDSFRRYLKESHACQCIQSVKALTRFWMEGNYEI